MSARPVGALESRAGQNFGETVSREVAAQARCYPREKKSTNKLKQIFSVDIQCCGGAVRGYKIMTWARVFFGMTKERCNTR